MIRIIAYDIFFFRAYTHISLQLSISLEENFRALTFFAVRFRGQHAQFDLHNVQQRQNYPKEPRAISSERGVVLRIGSTSTRRTGQSRSVAEGMG